MRVCVSGLVPPQEVLDKAVWDVINDNLMHFPPSIVFA
jgi:hypothetical protein